MGKWRYGVILDAGSSGTRVYIYRWLNSAKALHDGNSTTLHSLPRVETKKKWTKKIQPGVSTFSERPADVGGEHLRELLDHALDNVPKSQVADTPIFLMATAGVRLLEKPRQSALLSEICSYARKHTDFSLPDCDLHIQVIPGDTEGLYGWIAANYLLGGFDPPDQHRHGKGHHTYGFLDMGGASAQIAFAPNRTEAAKHANDLTLLRMRTMNGQPLEYEVFTTTWLGFGVNQARQRFVEALVEETYSQDATELLDPCLPAGLRTSLDGVIVSDARGVESKDHVLVGTGLFDECLRRTYPLLDKDAPCEDQPCLLHGQHIPAIDFDVNHFVGVSEYWHTTHEVFEMSHKDKIYNFKKYQTLVKEFCSQDWDDIEDGAESQKWGKKVDIKIAKEACFKASWLINVLHEGIGVPRISLETDASGSGLNATYNLQSHSKSKGFLDPFQAVDKIDDIEVSWTLGKMLLYAAGQIPPSATGREALPVGFGSNIDGIPADFQYAGSSANYVSLNDTSEEWSETADELIEHAQERPASIIMISLLIIFIIGYFLRRRDVRTRFYRGASNLLRRNHRLGSPKKAGRSVFHCAKFFSLYKTRGGYDHVMEEGKAADSEMDSDVEPEETEQSDSSETSRVGHSSGLATPKIGAGSESYFDPMSMSWSCSAGVGKSKGKNVPVGLRPGLVVRTESRERLAPGGSDRKSKAVSPTRGKGFLSPLDE